MKNEELYRYIKKKLEDGFSEDDIRTSLQGGGWDINEVNIGIFKAKEDVLGDKDLNKKIKKRGKGLDFFVLFSVIFAILLLMYAEEMLPKEVYVWVDKLLTILKEYLSFMF